MTGISEQIQEKPNIKGDRGNIILLLLMYSLQGVTSGLTYAMPIILQNRNVSYADQAEFSFAIYPFCLKLFWAPIVDCVFSKRLGRRKSWVIPTQYCMALTLLFASMNLNDWLGGENNTQKPKIRLLTLTFFLCIVFTAMQDVSLDAWSLTMLQKRNVGYAGNCQSIGYNVGYFLAYVGFIVLDSKEFCNVFRSVPQDHGFVSFTQFIFFWSMMLVIANTFVLIFKKDNSLEIIDDENCECRLGLKESYKHLWDVCKVRPILIFSLILLTNAVAFGPVLGVSHLKMISAGISRDLFVLLTVPAIPCQIILQVILRRSVTGPQSLSYFTYYYLLLLLSGILLAVVLYSLPFVRDEQKLLPHWYYALIFFLYNFRSISKGLMTVTMSSYFFRVSDPRYGGIYLTLLNSMQNIGLYWPQTLSLWIVDWLTITSCDENEKVQNCHTKFDGFYTEIVIFSVIGIVWLLWGKNANLKLQKLETSEWIAERKKKEMVQYEAIPVIIDKSVS